MTVENSKIIALDEREWLLKRPTVYLGPTSANSQEFYFPQYHKFQNTLYIPALQKLADEVIENAVDEYIRTDGKYANIISVTINNDWSMTVIDNGRGLPIEKHHQPQYKDKWVPEVIFTVMRSGSNFDDENRDGIGVNGVGVSLTTLFSNQFSVKTYQNHKSYYQEFNNMLLEISKPKIKDISSSATGTEITFLPNFEFFQATGWNVDMIQKRVIDLAYAHPGIKFKFNGETIKARKIIDYLFEDTTKESFEIEEGKNVRFIITTNNNGDFKFASFVNGANVFKGGHHIEYPLDEIINFIRPKLERKHKIELKPKDIRNHVSIFVWLNMKTPLFSSQTKEEIINTPAEIKSYFDDVLSERFYKKILSNNVIVDKIIEEAIAKKAISEKVEENRKKKEIKTHKVEKLLDANSDDRKKCILFLCEGDSAMSNSEGVRDLDYHAFLPLRGKVLNVYDVTTLKVLQNDVVKDITKTIGLEIGKKPEELSYGKIVLLTDADPDGAHIKSLLVNLFFKFWPSLFDDGLVCDINPPLYIANKGKEKIYIYSTTEYEDLNNKGKLKGMHISYFKGLAGLEKEDWNYLLNIESRFTPIKRTNSTVAFLDIIFGPDSNKRKEWLSK